MRDDVVDAAIRATRTRRYVPWSVCLICCKHYDHVHRAATGHPIETLTREEQDAVAAAHREAELAEMRAAAKFRRI